MLVKHRMSYDYLKVGSIHKEVYLCTVCDWHFSAESMKFSGRDDKAHRVLPKGFV